ASICWSRLASEIAEATASMIARVTEPTEVSRSGSEVPRVAMICEEISDWEGISASAQGPRDRDLLARLGGEGQRHLDRGRAERGLRRGDRVHRGDHVRGVQLAGGAAEGRLGHLLLLGINQLLENAGDLRADQGTGPGQLRGPDHGGESGAPQRVERVGSVRYLKRHADPLAQVG